MGKNKKLFNIYWCIVTFLGIVGIINFIFIDKPTYLIYSSYIPWMLAAIIVFIRSLELLRESRYTVTLHTTNMVFMVLTFHPAIMILPSIINNIIMPIKKYKDNKKRYFQIVLFNIGQEIISISALYYLSHLMKLNVTFSGDIWKIVVLMIIFSLVNALLVFIMIFIDYGKIEKVMFSFDATKFYYLYNIVTTILLIYTYHDRGPYVTLLIYVIFLPLQKVTEMYIELVDKERELFVDNLTQCYNYRYFEQTMSNLIDKKELFSLVMIDMNKFKQINDLYGHSAGNQALIDFSKIVKNKIPKDSIFCRYGGDEFCIIIKNTEVAKDIADSLVEETTKHIVEYEEYKFNISFSVGLYNHNGSEDTIQNILEKADKAMYTSKKSEVSEVVEYSKL